MTDNPYSSPVLGEIDSLSDDATGPWRTVAQPMIDISGYSRFLGIMLIGIGTLYCLTIFGAVIGWLPIWVGILFLKSGDNLNQGTAASTQDGLAQIAKVIRIVSYGAATFLGLLVVYLVFVVGTFVVLRLSLSQ